MSRSDHLNERLILRALDDELTAAEERVLNAHLGHCEACKDRYREWGLLSSDIQSLVESVPVRAPQGEREALINWLEKREREAAERSPAKHLVGWRVGAGMAMAAALVVAVLFMPKTHGPVSETAAGGPAAQPIQTFEVADESFVALPYRSSDLPLSAPEIVQMRVPVASLTEAGVVDSFGWNTGSSSGDDTVLADVLLGADGEPMGVHVLSVD